MFYQKKKLMSKKKNIMNQEMCPKNGQNAEKKTPNDSANQVNSMKVMTIFPKVGWFKTSKMQESVGYKQVIAV